ncbi:MAG: hypothetical protein ACR2PL_16155 [Dehalococcoidia bacterium]
MATVADQYQEHREQLITRFEALTRQDPRVLALWLQGSLSDGTEDALSDIDAHIAIEDAAFDAVVVARFPSGPHQRIPATMARRSVG